MAREQLAGSMGNWGNVFRDGDVVVRPVGPHTRAVTVLLEALASSGFPAPVPAGFTEGGEQRLGWIDGEVPAEPPFPAWSQTDGALASMAGLLRRYHDTVAGLELPGDLAWAREFADPHGGPIICHNDVCWPNVVFRGGRAAALLDFDYAAPGRPVWDLAQMSRMSARLRPADPELPVGSEHEPFRRLGVLVAAYGLDPAEHGVFVDALCESWRVGMAFVHSRVLAGQAQYVEIWERHGGEAGIERAISWLVAHRSEMLAVLAEQGAQRALAEHGAQRAQGEHGALEGGCQRIRPPTWKRAGLASLAAEGAGMIGG